MKCSFHYFAISHQLSAVSQTQNIFYFVFADSCLLIAFS